MRQISAYKHNRAAREMTVKHLATYLEQRTFWGKHMARPSQVQAGARKLYDVLKGQLRREHKAAVQE